MLTTFYKIGFVSSCSLARYYVYVQFCLQRPSLKWPILCWVGR